MTANISEVVSKVPTGLLINGEWVDAKDGATFDVENPATGEVIATLASAGEDDAMAALDAACAVQDEWAATSPRERSDILRRACDLVQERSDTFATLMTREMGKALRESRGELTCRGEFLRWFSEEAVRDYGRSFPAPEGTLNMITRRKPVGPCLLI